MFLSLFSPMRRLVSTGGTETLLISCSSLPLTNRTWKSKSLVIVQSLVAVLYKECLEMYLYCAATSMFCCTNDNALRKSEATRMNRWAKQAHEEDTAGTPIPSSARFSLLAHQLILQLCSLLISKHEQQ